MYKEHKIGVVVLAHNEENHIKNTIEALPDFVDKIYVIDDGSTDKTAEIVKTLTDKRIRLLQHEVNKGPGAALVTDKPLLFNKKFLVKEPFQVFRGRGQSPRCVICGYKKGKKK